MSLLFNSFESLKMGRQQKREALYWNMGKSCLRGRAHKNPMGLYRYDGPTETVECMGTNIRCMLDWIVEFYHKTAEIHFLGTQLINQ